MSLESSIHLHQEDNPENQSIDASDKLLSTFFKASSNNKENNQSFIVNGNPKTIISFLENKEVNLNEKINLLTVLKIKLEGNRLLKTFFDGDWGLGIGDWGLGIGDWGLGIGPNPQSPIPHPQSPIPNFSFLFRNCDLNFLII